MNSVLIERMEMECPICGMLHEVERRKKTSEVVIKGETVSYEAEYLFCCNADEEEQCYVTGKMMDENLLRARNAYRTRHDLLTSDEIVKLRKMYGLSQVELANLLGWGGATISRYESKAIQDDAYDNVLRLIKDNPYVALKMLENHHESFSEHRYNMIFDNIVDYINVHGKELLSRQSLESEYVKYYKPSDKNGNIVLNIDKLEAMITYLALRIRDLYKVKLMKLLWYADAESFKTYGHAISGLVYCHKEMGALPIGHYKIMALENVLYKECETSNFESSSFLFVPNNRVDLSCLTHEDKITLNKIINKFGRWSGKDLMCYMHDEVAYKETDSEDIIPFRLAGQIRDI